MKKKLIAAVTSLVMVATLAPATAFAGTTATPNTATKAVSSEQLSQKAKAFQEAVENLKKLDRSYASADITSKTWQNINNTYLAGNSKLTPEEQESVKASIADFQAIQKDIIKVVAEKMESRIAALPKLIEADQDFTAIGQDVAYLEKVNANLAQDVTNYKDYTNAQAAKNVALAIKEVEEQLQRPYYKTASWAVEHLGKVDAFKNATEEVRSKAANYGIYKAAAERVNTAETGLQLIKDYNKYFNDARTALVNDKTERNLEAAKRLIQEAKNDAALQAALKNKDIDVADTANTKAKDTYEARLANLKSAITSAETYLKNAAFAADYTAKVNAVTEVSLDAKTIAAIQELFESYTTATNTSSQVATTVQNQAASLINQLKAEVAKVTKDADKAALTKEIIAAFPVPEANDVTLEDAAAITIANKVVVNKRLVDNTTQTLTGHIDEKTEYIVAKKKVEAAAAALTVKQNEAKDAAKKFGDAIKAIPAMSAKDWTDPTLVKNYAVRLNEAKALYDALPKACQEGGAYYNNQDYAAYGTKPTATTIQTAYEDLMAKIEALNEDVTAEDNAIIVELIGGIVELKPADKLTIADKDAVYALRDLQNKLSKAGKAKFDKLVYADNKTKETRYSDTLKAAIKAIDQLVVKDLIQQIDALTIVKSDASLEEIQKAKAANKAARDAYDALTATQQKEVTNSTVLEKAEKAVADAEVTYIKDQLVVISKLDTKALTLDQAKQIQAIADMIDALDTAHKESVKADVYYKALKPALEAAQKVIKAATALENATITAIPDQTYTGKAIEPAVEVKDAANNVIDPNAYTVSYENNINAGTAKVIVSSKTPENPTGHQTAEFKINPADASKATITVANRTYTGKALKPIVKVVVNGKALAEDTDYTVAYKNNTKVGQAKVTVTAQGNYTGTAAKAFVVKPGKATVTSLKAGKKKATVKIKAIPGATTYKIAYKQRGTAYKYQYKTTTATAKTITGLKAGKVYKVKVLAYTKVNGKSYYTGYSTIKTVKVK